MSLNFITFVLFYFLLIPSIVGYGYLAVNFTKLDKKQFNKGYLGLIGVFFLILYSYLSHFLIPHNLINNSIIFIVGLMSFIFYFNRDRDKKSFILINIVFLLLIIGAVIYKSHDDFFYYHFPYTYYLTQNNIFVGVGSFNHGFRTPSSIFYLNSLFYLPLIKYYSFQMGAIMIMGFTNFIFLDSIYKNIKKKIFNNVLFLSLLSFVFINIFFYRISEHGTDRSAQILIFLFFIELFILINLNKNFSENSSKVIVLLGLITTLKAFYILYVILVFPIFYYLIKKKYYKHILNIFQNSFFYFFILLFTSFLITNFFNTGCLIYPVNFTCFDNFSWSIPSLEIIQMNNWYEQWSKAGAGPSFRVMDPEIYIQNFNWVSNWIEKYFFTKISDLLLGLLFLIIVFLITFYSKNYKINSTYKKTYLLYGILLLLFCEWFYNHPALRYGGYPIVALILFVPLSNILGSIKYNQKDIKKKVILIIMITFTVFLLRNFDRIIKENKKYGYLPLQNITYQVDDRHFRIQKEFEDIVLKNKDCIEKKNYCTNHPSRNVRKIFKYLIFSRK